MDANSNTNAPLDRPEAAGGATSSKDALRAANASRKGKTKRKTRSAKEVEEVTDFVVLLLNRRQTKSFIKKAVNNQFFKDKPVTARTIESYLARARKKIRDATKKPPEWHKLRVLNFYESVASGPDADLGERLRAQERIDKLLGLEAPAEHHIAGKDGGPTGIAIREIVIEHHTPGPDVPADAEQPILSRSDRPVVETADGEADRPVSRAPDAELDVHG